MFQYFNSFVSSGKNDIDVLIADEAHRIRETSANRFTRASERTGQAQISELLDVAQVPVFLLDEHQVVRPRELGTAAVIREAAISLGLTVEEVGLDGQFRCGGSRAYEEWVLRLLGLAEGGPEAWDGDEHFRLLVANSPQEMEMFLGKKMEEGYSARMTAGFCWPWSRPERGEALVDDVRIRDWARPWNNPEERAIGDIPARSLWATQPGGFGQVGCVYTAQGFEYDWNGVIFGPDLVWRHDRFESDKSASRDPAFRGKRAEAGFDSFVRNVYKVLLTRGMVGTVIYSTDAQTQRYLHDLVSTRVE
jgi:hypothetical protein